MRFFLWELNVEHHATVACLGGDVTGATSALLGGSVRRPFPPPEPEKLLFVDDGPCGTFKRRRCYLSLKTTHAQSTTAIDKRPTRESSDVTGRCWWYWSEPSTPGTNLRIECAKGTRPGEVKGAGGGARLFRALISFSSNCRWFHLCDCVAHWVRVDIYDRRERREEMKKVDHGNGLSHPFGLNSAKCQWKLRKGDDQKQPDVDVIIL